MINDYRLLIVAQQEIGQGFHRLTRIPAFAGTGLTDKKHNNSVFLSKNAKKALFLMILVSLPGQESTFYNLTFPFFSAILSREKWTHPGAENFLECLVDGMTEVEICSVI